MGPSPAAAEGPAASSPPAAPPAESPTPTPSPPPTPLIFLSQVSLALHLGVAALVAATFFNGSLFGYHPSLMALAFLLLMPEGILAAVRGTGKGRKRALYLHLVLNAAAGVAGLAGLAAIWLNKERLGKPHLASVHALCGLGALVSAALISLGGVPMLFGWPPALRKTPLSKTVSKAHKQIGAATSVLGAAVCISGLQTFKPAHPLHKGPLTYVLAGLCALSALIVVTTIQRKKAAKAKAKGKIKTG